MSEQTLLKLETYKKKYKLSDLAIAGKLSQNGGKIYPIYLYRWRKAGRIIGVYERIVEEFLKIEESKNSGK